MQKLLLPLLLLVYINISAQEYDLNKYKYRFQKIRAFTTTYNLNNSGNLYNNRRYNTLSISFTERKSVSNNFNFAINGNYFKDINLEKWQHSEIMNSNFTFSNNINKENYVGDPGSANYSGNLHQVSNLLEGYLSYAANNRFYNGEKFKLLNYNGDATINSNNEKTVSHNVNPSPLYNHDNTIKNNSLGLSGNIQLGFGKGRLEYVSDPIMAIFMIKDLQKKTGIGELSNEQIEGIAKGFTTIRNTRFIDFRFRLIDQIEMLDSILKAYGVKTDKQSRYFTTIYDNWLYANREQRYSGKRWTYSLDNKATLFNRSSEQNEKVSNPIHRAQNYKSRTLYNGLAVQFDYSKQLNVYKQRTYGANFNIGLNHETQVNIDKDSIGTSGETKNEFKYKPDNLNSTLGAYYGYLYQPNTRTFLIVSINPYASLNRTLYGLRRDNANNTYSTDFIYGLKTDLRYFKFFNPRLSVFFNIGLNLFKTTNTFGADTPNNTTISKVNIFTNEFTFNHGISTGITYTLF